MRLQSLVFYSIHHRFAVVVRSRGLFFMAQAMRAQRNAFRDGATVVDWTVMKGC